MEAVVIEAVATMRARRRAAARHDGDPAGRGSAIWRAAPWTVGARATSVGAMEAGAIDTEGATASNGAAASLSE